LESVADEQGVVMTTYEGGLVIRWQRLVCPIARSSQNFPELDFYQGYGQAGFLAFLISAALAACSPSTALQCEMGWREEDGSEL